MSDDANSAASNPAPVAPAWLWWSALAVLATLAHSLIDAHIGLWGETSSGMSLIQAANALVTGALYGWWMLAVAMALRGDRWALRTVLLYTAIYCFLIHGLIAIIVAPPPAAAFPYQDIAHFASLIVGGVATLILWPRARDTTSAGRKYVFMLAAAIILANQALSGVTFLVHV